MSPDQTGIEQALAKTESDATATFKAATSVVISVRRFQSAAKTGDLKALRSSLEATERAMTGLRQQFANAKDGWTFDEDSYLSSGLYAKEVLTTARGMGVNIYERDDRLYCYPALIRVSPADKAVYIDKKREGKVRPSVLVSRLKELQRKPPPFRLDAFLSALFNAYTKVVAMEKQLRMDDAPVIPLLDIYEMFTLLPGQAREYTKQEFGRDIYLLHRSDTRTTKSGEKVTFPFTGRMPVSRILTVIDEEGGIKQYYGVSFLPKEKEQQT